jgi:NADPH:quinone reductase-like Zn-dependent oxidoreductase
LIIRLIFGWSRPKHPIFGAECAGTIEAVAPGVHGFATGDAVFAQPKIARGCHAEFTAVAADRVIPKPAALTWDEAGSFGFGSTTALHFLKLAGIAPGKRVLIIGGSGTVGSAAIQIAKAKGAHLTAVASDANRALCTELGADAFIDYRAEDVTKSAERFDIIMDCIGSLPFRRARKLLTPQGRFLGIVAGLPAMLGGMFNIFRSKKAIYGVADGRREVLLELAALAEAGAYKPLIDETFPLERAREAHARVETHRKRGSVVLRMPVMNELATEKA